MGCGRVGTRLALSLVRLDRSVSVIDQDPQAFRRLGTKFPGRKIEGVGFDRDTLLKAGIEQADAFAAVSNGDNSNILAARVARETFGVRNVVARIYDPRRAEVYERLGIPTVATVAWTAGQILRRIEPIGGWEEWRDATGSIALIEVAVHASWVGHPPEEIARLSGARLAFITRYGRALLPGPDTLLQEDDLVHVLCEPGAREAVAEIFGRPREVG